jgi:hypothetical protein
MEYIGTIEMKEQSMNRTEIIEKRIADLEREAAELKRFGPDIYEDGEVLVFSTRFGKAKGEGTKYSFAALKAGGRWYLTGPMYGGRAYSWDDLVSFWRASKVRSVKVVMATEFVIRGRFTASE